MRYVLIATAALISTALPALAADLQVEQPAIVADSGIDWTGAYIGASVGYAKGTIDWTAQGYDAGTSLGILAYQEGSFDASGWLGGVQAGYNLQTGNLVFGLEGDVNWTDITGSETRNDSEITSTLETLSSLRGRFGVAFDKVLLFASAGWAYGTGHIDVSNIDGQDGTLNTEDFTANGWTAGVGAALALDNNWSLTAEYRYTTLDNDEVQFGAPVQYGNSADGDYLAVNGTADFHLFKVGLNYKF